MIAAVVHPRGAAAASVVLERMASAATWREIRTRGGAIVASDVACSSSDGLALREATSLDAASREAHTGAFVALDADFEGSVLLSCGSFGGRSLFHAHSVDGAFVACSQMVPLLAAVERSRLSADADRLASLCVCTAEPRVESTAFSGVARVAPCTTLRAGASHIEAKVRPRVELGPLDGDPVEIAEELWRRFEGSVRFAIGDARTVAVMVGGGVDSSALLAAAVAVARGASPKEVHALALDFDAVGTDRPYLAALADALGIAPVRIAPGEAAPFFAGSHLLDAQPYWLSIGPMEQLVFHRARELGASTLLTGYLADEILAGDLRGFAAEASHSPLAAVRAAVELRLPWETTARERVMNYVLRPLVKPLLPRALIARLSRSSQDVASSWAGTRMRKATERALAHSSARLPPRTPTERFERFARDDAYAEFADLRSQLEATTGVVRKDPFANESVLELLARVRPTLQSHGDMHRGLFRLAASGRLPERVRTRLDKSYFEPAFAEVATSAGGFDVLGDLWLPRALERLDILDAVAFRRAMAPLFAMPASTSQSGVLWTYASIVLSCERFARMCEATS
ncbi:MAG: hypothetical protein JST00_27645 [Deltaproteobacteria bacterium]|nr:hypothetical protein [Deltaproteobacteria bacterium]